MVYIETSKLIAGFILLVVGILFFFNNKNIAKGASKFYQMFYSEKNLKIMFKIIGIILFIFGIILIVNGWVF